MALKACVLAQLSALGLTVAIAFAFPDGVAKPFVLLAVWWFLFRPLEAAEIVLFVAACGIFTVMNYMALANGIFVFKDPQFLLMPYHETVMWGFYLLYVSRGAESGYRVPVRTSIGFWACLLLFAAPYSLIHDPILLLACTGLVLAAALTLNHEKGDWIAFGSAIGIGVLFEQLGVHMGRWSYPSHSAQFWGVPFWSPVLWGGSGFFASRILQQIRRFRS